MLRLLRDRGACEGSGEHCTEHKRQTPERSTHFQPSAFRSYAVRFPGTRRGTVSAAVILTGRRKARLTGQGAGLIDRDSPSRIQLPQDQVHQHRQRDVDPSMPMLEVRSRSWMSGSVNGKSCSIKRTGLARL